MPFTPTPDKQNSQNSHQTLKQESQICDGCDATLQSSELNNYMVAPDLDCLTNPMCRSCVKTLKKDGWSLA